MVKKKSKRSRHKGRSSVRQKKVKRKGAKRTSLKDVHDTFSSYEEQIDRLQALERELKVLDTRGFKPEVNLIKAKLKDPSALPNIERLMRKIRKGILKRPKKKSRMKKIQKSVTEISEDLPTIKRSIQNLKRELNVQNIPKLHKQVEKLKREHEEEEKNKDAKKIDSGVGVLVEEKYGDFIGALKKDLTEKEQKEEKSLKEKLKRDFSERERELEIKYQKMLEGVKDNYERRVENHLDQEVKKKFGEKLNACLVLEKVKLENKYSEKYRFRIREGLDDEKKILRKKMHKEYGKKLQARVFDRDRKLDDEIKKLNLDKREFHRKLSDEYRRKLHKEAELKKEELRDEFHDELLEELKINVIQQKKKLKEDFNLKLRKEVGEERRKTQKEYDLKIKDYEKGYRNKLKKLDLKKQKLLSDVQDKRNILNKDKVDFNKRAEALRSRTEVGDLELDRLRKELESEAAVMDKREAAFELKSNNLKKEFAKKRKGLDARVNLVRKKSDAKFERAKTELRQKLSVESDEKVRSLLSKERKRLREKYQGKYESKFNYSFAREKNILQKEYDKKFSELESRRAQIQRQRNKLDKKQRKISKKFANEQEKLKLSKDRAARVLVEVRMRLKHKELEEIRKQKGKLKAEEENRVDKIKKKFEDALKKNVSIKESDLKKKSQIEFVRKIRDLMNKKENVLQVKYNAKLAQILEVEKKKLSISFDSKKKDLEKELYKDVQALEIKKQKLLSDIQEKKNSLNIESSNLNRKFDDLSNKKKLLDMEFSRKKKKLEVEAQILTNKEAGFEIRKKDLEDDFAKKKKFIDNKFDLLKKRRDAVLNREKSRVEKILTVEYHRKLNSALYSEEKSLREKLEKEFAQKIKDRLSQAKIISKKKLDLNKKRYAAAVRNLEIELGKRDKDLEVSKRNLAEKLNIRKKKFELALSQTKKRETEDKKIFVERLKAEEAGRINAIHVEASNKLKDELAEKTKELLDKQKDELAQRKKQLEKEIKGNISRLMK